MTLPLVSFGSTSLAAQFWMLGTIAGWSRRGRGSVVRRSFLVLALFYGMMLVIAFYWQLWRTWPAIQPIPVITPGFPEGAGCHLRWPGQALGLFHGSGGAMLGITPRHPLSHVVGYFMNATV